MRPQTRDLNPDFDDLYGQRYRGTPHYDDAKAAFSSRALTPRWEMGVNTWHEQVLAGRIPLSDIKTVGMARLGKASRVPGIRYRLLSVMAGTDGKVEPKLVRLALEMFDRAQSEYGHADKTTMHHALFLAGELGMAAGEIPCWPDVYDSAAKEIERELGPLPIPPDRAEAALKLAKYAGDYWTEVHALTRRADGVPGRTYRNFDFTRLMRAGISPSEAARDSEMGMTVERAIEAHGHPSAVADGAL